MNQILEIPVTLGSQATLTCLIEPLPAFKKLIWLKPNGYLVPNSIYTSHEKYNDLDSYSNNKFKFNFKVKYENLTKFNSDSKIDETNFNKMNEDENRVYANHNDVIVANEATGLMKSILYIKNVRKQDLGIYKCKSINSYGSRTVMILLREKTLIGNLSINSNFIKVSKLSKNFLKLDKMNISGNISLITLIMGTFIVCILFIIMLMCIISKKIRQLCCCCRSGRLKTKENGKNKIFQFPI